MDEDIAKREFVLGFIKKHKIEQIFTPNILPFGSLAYFLKIPYIISLHGLDINLALKNKQTLTLKETAV